jgi:hypothetical protein
MLATHARHPRRNNAPAFDNLNCPFAPLAREALPTEGRVLFTTLLDTDQAKTWSNINVYW